MQRAKSDRACGDGRKVNSGLSHGSIGCADQRDGQRFNGPSPTSEQPKRGGTLRTGQVGDPLNLDPHYLTPLSGDTTFAVLDRLIAYDDKLQPQPQLAESWDQSSDLKQIKFNLRIRRAVSRRSRNDQRGREIQYASRPRSESGRLRKLAGDAKRVVHADRHSG
jgi:hypothetical protein